MLQVVQVCVSMHAVVIVRTLVAVVAALALIVVLGVLVRVVATAMEAVMIIAR